MVKSVATKKSVVSKAKSVTSSKNVKNAKTNSKVVAKKASKAQPSKDKKQVLAKVNSKAQNAKSKDKAKMVTKKVSNKSNTKNIKEVKASEKTKTVKSVVSKAATSSKKDVNAKVKATKVIAKVNAKASKGTAKVDAKVEKSVKAQAKVIESGEIEKITSAIKPNNDSTLSYTQLEFYDNIRAFCGLEKRAQAKEICDDITSFIIDALSKGYKVPFLGLGKLYVRKTKARSGKNPTTGEIVHIKAKSRVRFIPAKSLVDFE